MEPIGKTYSGASNSTIYDAYRNSLMEARNGSQREIPAPETSRDQSTEEQQGIWKTTSKRQEFQPYSMNGRVSSSDGQQKQDKNIQKQTTSDSTGLPAKQQEAPQAQQEVAQLKNIEEKVKAHETAHKSSGAPTGPISYTYTRGPDGKNYITGGEVPITISTGNTPQETVNRMQQVIQAALAPADPSPQDRAVASQASNLQQQARQEMSSQPAAASPEKETAPVTVKKSPDKEGEKARATTQEKGVNSLTNPVPANTGSYGKTKPVSISFYA